MSSSSHGTQARMTASGVRWMLLISFLLVLLVGILLYILTGQTDRYFSWTINPPLTAAALGAGYWAAGIVELMASRQRLWDRTRLAMPAVMVFSTTMLIVTLVHLDRFHFGADLPLTARLAAWIWVAVYVIVPILDLAALIQQSRIAGVDSPRTDPLPRWLRVLLPIQGIVLLILGVIYLLIPQVGLEWWPWQLTPLTARAIGAWMAGIAVALFHAAWENDRQRIQVGVIGYVVFPILQLIALARYASTVQWNEPGAWLYVLFLISMLGAGVFGWFEGRMKRRG